MSTRWGERETRIFVKLYLSHVCLWDKNHTFYKCRADREDATKDIIEKFAALTNISLDIGTVKNKIKNLKSTYIQELKNLQDRSTAKRRPTLKWFHDFHRCFGPMNLKKEGLEVELEPEEGSDNLTQEVWLDQPTQPNSSVSDQNKSDVNQDPFNQDDYILLLKTESGEQSTESVKFPSMPRKRKIKKQPSSSEDDDYSHNYPRKSKSKYRRDNSKEYPSPAKEDEFDIYGKYIATQLRHMGLQKALKVQLKIHSIVSEARMEMSGDES